MKKIFLFINMILSSVMYCQTFNGTTGSVPSCIGSNPLTAAVSGIGSNSRLKSITFTISDCQTSDMKISLQAPNGNTMTIADEMLEFSFGYFAYTTISCDATVRLYNDFPPYSGNYLPYPLTGFEFFNGIDLNGVWKFYVCDAEGGAYGTVENWSLNFYTPDDLSDNAQLQIPNVTISADSEAAISGMVYEAGLTDTTTAPTNIEAWVGYSNTNTNPATWNTWVPATFVQNVGNSDEYMGYIGQNLTAGTYYYAIKFKEAGADYATYGATNGGFWNGINHNNGMLTVIPPTVPVNDNICNAIPLTVNQDYSCDVITHGGTTAGATPSSLSGCGMQYNDVWYSFVATAATHKISFPGDTSLSHSIWTGTDCNNVTMLPNSCATNWTGLVSGFVPGQTYFLRIWSANFNICIGTEPTPPDLVTLQLPASATVPAYSSLNVLGHIYKAGFTDTYNRQVPGIKAWIGSSLTNTHPITWSSSSWKPMTFNQQAGNDDEYIAALNSYGGPTTIYYATRYNYVESGQEYFGGIDSDNNGGFWDGVTYKNGVMTVEPTLPPVNDDCSGATQLTVGHFHSEYPVTGNGIGATDTEVIATMCNGTPIYINRNVWYKAIVPDSGRLMVHVQKNVAFPTYPNFSIQAYTGSCGSLTQIACGHYYSDYNSGNYSASAKQGLYGLIPGSTVYITVYATSFYPNIPPGTAYDFEVSAYWGDYLLDADRYEFDQLSYYPNPVTDLLTLTNDKDISSIEIYNMLGQQVRSYSINARETKVNLSDLQNGMYLVYVFSNGQRKMLKVIKQ